MITISSALRSLAGRLSAVVAALGLMTIAVLYIASHPGLVSTAHANSTSADEKDLGRSRCSDHTLRGRYAVRGEGWVPNGPPGSPMVPFANVSLMTLDGDGNLTNDITVSRNGQISQNIDTGTYSVGNNCKGTMAINIATPPFQLTFDLVVADGGKEFIFIATTPSVVTHEAKSLD